MSGFTINNPQALFLFGLIPLLGYLQWRGRRLRARDEGAFAENAKLIRSTAWRDACLLVGVLLLMIGATRPAWDPHPKPLRHYGRDVIFALDISKSMLATDVQPSRLEHAKESIRDCVATLHGDRVGLVVFAGSAVIKCPLTTDHAFFLNTLDEVDWTSVNMGGTRIGDALFKISDKLLTESDHGLQDVIVITDGEDHDVNSAKAVAEIDAKGVRLIIMGLGDAVTGSRVELDEGKGMQFLKDGEVEVWTKMNPSRLKALANSAPKGIFLNVGTQSIAFGKVYQRLIKNDRKRILGNEQVLIFTEKFQLFLAPGALLLMIGFFLNATRVRQALASLALCLVLSTACTPNAAEQQANAAFKAGWDAFQRESFEEAAEAFAQASASTDPTLAHPAAYDMATSLIHLGLKIKDADEHAALAALDQAIAILDVTRRHSPGSPLSKATLINLEVAEAIRRELLDDSPPPRNDMNDQQQADDQEGEGDESESDDGEEEGENDGEESSTDTRMSGDFASDLQNQDVPPPTNTPQDIFREEMENNSVRQKSKPTKYKKVKKDW